MEETHGFSEMIEIHRCEREEVVTAESANRRHLSSSQILPDGKRAEEFRYATSGVYFWTVPVPSGSIRCFTIAKPAKMGRLNI